MKLVALFLFSLSILHVSAQVAVNTDGSAPHSSAMLEVTSTNSGVLIPRMTAAQRDGIPTPATGLMVYVTDDNLFHFFNGNAWVAIAPSAGNPTDELQTLSRTGTDVTLSDGGGAVSVADNDNDSSNELQTLSKTGTNITLSNGGGTVSVADNDNNSTNELDSKWTVANGAIHHNDGEVGIGTDNPDALFHLSSDTQSDATGLKITQEDANSLMYHDNGDLILRKQSEANQLVLDTGGNVGIGTNAPSRALDINGQIRIRGGSPSAGKILTASNANGEAAWSQLSILDEDTAEVTTPTTGGGSGAGYTDIGAAGTLSSLSNSDRVLVINSFRMRLNGGSGTDTARFRIKATNTSEGGTQVSMDTGVLDDLNRDNWMLYSFHRVMQISNGAGNYRFDLEIDDSLSDDPIQIDQHQNTVIRLTP